MWDSEADWERWFVLLVGFGTAALPVILTAHGLITDHQKGTIVDRRTIFGRDPVFIASLAIAFVQILCAFWLPWSDEQQSLVNAAIAFLFSAISVLGLAAERQVPVLVGLAQALLAVAVGFGLELTPEQSTMLVGLVALVAGAWTRTQVVAHIPPPIEMLPRNTMLTPNVDT